MEQIIIPNEVYTVLYRKLKVRAVKVGSFSNGMFLQVKLLCPFTKKEVISTLPITRCEKVKEVNA